MKTFARITSRFALAGVFAAAAGLSACDGGSAVSGGVTQVVSTTSFGMCVGYCSTRLEITEGQAVFTRDGRGGRGGQDLPPQRFTSALSPGEWQEIKRLAGEAKIEPLPERIGCPDCADGGAESLTIVGPGRNKTITFDHGANIAEAQGLLERVRALRAKLTPAQ